MIFFKKTTKDKIDSLPNDGESIVFAEDKGHLYIDGTDSDGNKIRTQVVSQPENLHVWIDEEDGHMYYEYGGDAPNPPSQYKIMTIKIDQNNPDPEACCTYADDAVGMTPGSEDWDAFFGHYPVLFKDGVEVGKLQRDNFQLFEDGSNANITSLDSGDVMICFPKLGMKMSTDENDIVTLSITNNPNAEADGFEYNAHISSVDGVSIVDKFYTGAFKGYVSNNKLYSVINQTPAGSATISKFRTYAQNKGTGYNMSTYYRLLFRQCLYLLKYKNLNSQDAVGKGVVGAKLLTTGETILKGMDYGDASTMDRHVKCLGIEDFWGNIDEFIDGIYSDSSRNILIGTTNFNNDGTGYANVGSSGFASNIDGYISKIQGDTKKGFIIKNNAGNETTYFCDYGVCFASSLGTFGGDYSMGGYRAGVFRFELYRTASNTNSGLGARLEYCA